MLLKTQDASIISDTFGRLLRNGETVKVGDRVELRGGIGVVAGAREPHKPASQGFVHVRMEGDGNDNREYYCNVIDAEWEKRPDRA